MERHGNTVKTQGGFKIVELIVEYMNGSIEVLGYNIFGPGTRSNRLYTKDEAEAKFAELVAPSNAQRNSPRPH